MWKSYKAFMKKSNRIQFYLLYPAWCMKKVYDNYGRPSFIKVRVKNVEAPKEYIACDFGRKIYQDREAFEQSLSVLDEEEKNYVLGLPWPLEKVWHVKNENFERISSRLSMK